MVILAVLTDQDKGREKDRLQGNYEREKLERIWVKTQGLWQPRQEMPEYPPSKPDYVHIDKGYTPTKTGNCVGNIVGGGALGSCGSLQLGNQLDIALRERSERFWRCGRCPHGMGPVSL